jgi:hypothetical protein
MTDPGEVLESHHQGTPKHHLLTTPDGWVKVRALMPEARPTYNLNGSIGHPLFSVPVYIDSCPCKWEEPT